MLAPKGNHSSLVLATEPPPQGLTLPKAAACSLSSTEPHTNYLGGGGGILPGSMLGLGEVPAGSPGPNLAPLYRAKWYRNLLGSQGWGGGEEAGTGF